MIPCFLCPLSRLWVPLGQPPGLSCSRLYPQHPEERNDQKPQFLTNDLTQNCTYTLTSQFQSLHWSELGLWQVLLLDSWGVRARTPFPSHPGPKSPTPAHVCIQNRLPGGSALPFPAGPSRLTPDPVLVVQTHRYWAGPALAVLP